MLRNLIFILLAFLFMSLITIKPTVRSRYVFMYANDTVIFMPTETSPGMALVTNSNETGAVLFDSDTEQDCWDIIYRDSLNCGVYHDQIFTLNNSKIYINEKIWVIIYSINSDIEQLLSDNKR